MLGEAFRTCRLSCRVGVHICSGFSSCWYGQSMCRNLPSWAYLSLLSSLAFQDLLCSHMVKNVVGSESSPCLFLRI
ncbi:uncharacterized protein [Physcomitrium patens]|uniref:uncharacterized protein n=1 Tax=Physcomitrium patens TaxID=3218 RepID=UPI003CCDEAC7